MLRRWFISGVVVLIPIILTIYIIGALINFADKFIGNFINKVFSAYFGWSLPGLGIIFSFFIILFVGIIASFAKFKFIKGIEAFFLRMPLVSKIYPPLKRIVNFLFSSERPVFKRVVLIEYPRKGIYSLGFVTNESYSNIQEKTGRKMLNVFVPSSPSPLTGFTVIISEEEVIFLDIKVEEATQIIVSGGMLNPERKEEPSL